VVMGIERFGRERISMPIRTVLLAALAAVIPLSAGAQDACTADFGTHVGARINGSGLRPFSMTGRAMALASSE
jgi:hypothetical protein